MKKDLMILINFVIHYMSIEDDLLIGSIIDGAPLPLRSFPIGVKRVFSETPVSKDNVFAHLNIFYAIVDMAKQTGPAALRKETYKTNDPVAHDRFINRGMACVDFRNNPEVKAFFINLAASASASSAFTCAAFENVSVNPVFGRINETNQTQDYVLYGIEGVRVDYAIDGKYCEKIEDRLSVKIDEIYEIDRKCRELVGYGIVECRYLEEGFESQEAPIETTSANPAPGSEN